MFLTYSQERGKGMCSLTPQCPWTRWLRGVYAFFSKSHLCSPRGHQRPGVSSCTDLHGSRFRPYEDKGYSSVLKPGLFAVTHALPSLCIPLPLLMICNSERECELWGTFSHSGERLLNTVWLAVRLILIGPLCNGSWRLCQILIFQYVDWLTKD